MQIANPIYDVVFKYLMEDAKIAKLLISSIIGEEIETLDFRPQEFTADIDTGLEGRIGLLTVYRLDFSATINTVDGPKQVLIEIQKAKYATDIMRFRGYLGSQYSNKTNVKLSTINNHERKIGIPIIGIYFLGHKLDSTDASIIGVNRIYKDLVTGELLTVKDTNKVQHEAVRLLHVLAFVLIGSIYPCDSLQERVITHWLIQIHRIENRRVIASK